MSTSSSNAASDSKAVLGFVLFGGPLSGALVRDVRLANECAERGWPVHVWWAMDRTKGTKFHPSIQQHWLFNGLRFRHKHGRAALDLIGKGLNVAFSDTIRALRLQKRPRIIHRLMH